MLPSSFASASVPMSKNALEGLEQSHGVSRLFFIFCIVFGVLFAGVGIYKIFSVVSSMIAYPGPISFWRGVLVLGNALPSFLVATGFFLCRKWLLTAFIGNVILLVLTGALYYVQGSSIQWINALRMVLFFSSLLAFILLGWRYLMGHLLERWVLFLFLLPIASFVIIALLSNS